MQVARHLDLPAVWVAELQMVFSHVELQQGQTLAEASIRQVRVRIFGLGVMGAMVWQGALIEVLGVKKAHVKAYT